ncbi:hypothetical protein MHZ92_10065 [Sporosarcina sp. ACRSL]|uniref:hypothetical protein n=1 Tax=Sporosarcina sp. ACRSL TaxID=2918215 RepID=UPI001EF73A19|nr:hypothetical protein [Sporosarcina sp. ACRSL]MCG7344480.1 hypothetical protein [Sporosarcina sp. ACRSL]
MFKRKMLSFIWTILISTPIIGFCFMIVEGSDLTEVPALMLFVLIFAAPVVLFFGLPVTILSDQLNKRFEGKKRMIASFVTHLFFAISFVVLVILITESRFIFTDFIGFELVLFNTGNCLFISNLLCR